MNDHVAEPFRSILNNLSTPGRRLESERANAAETARGEPDCYPFKRCPVCGNTVSVCFCKVPAKSR